MNSNSSMKIRFYREVSTCWKLNRSDNDICVTFFNNVSSYCFSEYSHGTLLFLKHELSLNNDKHIVIILHHNFNNFSLKA